MNEIGFQHHRTSIIFSFVVWALVFVGFYLTSLYNFLLFHGLAELFSIIVAFAIFILAWNTRGLLDNHYLLFLGITYLFVGFIDVVHTFAYKGMNIFKGFDANLPTQLWIIGRYMESLSLLIAPFFINRKVKTNIVFALYASATVFLLLLLFTWRAFPDCFIEGTGLTTFKKTSEYLISLILLASLVFILQYREFFDKKVLKLIVWSIITKIISELAFTFYVGVYGFSNLVGHCCKIGSFYLIYKAIIETGLARPYDLLFRKLLVSETRLREERDKIQRYLDVIGVMLIVIDSERKVVLTNRKACEILGYTEEEIIGKDWFETFLPEKVRNQIQGAFQSLLSGEIKPYEFFENAVLTKSGEEKIIAWHNTFLKDEHGNIIATLSSGEDITEKRRTEEAFKIERERFFAFIEGAPFGIVVVEQDGTFAYMNEKFHEVFGYTLEEIPNGKEWFRKAYPDPDYRKNVIATWLQETAGMGNGERLPKVFTVNCKDSSKKIINFKTVHFEGGISLVACEDITERVKAEEAIKHMAYHDMLTGLPNRALLIDRLTMAMSQAERNQKKVAFMVLDLDRFKEVNDTFGHHIGDLLLKAAAGRLTEILRKVDTVARFGGDEFVLVLPEQKDTEGAVEAACKIVESFLSPFFLDGHTLSITASIGITFYPDHGTDIDTILKNADSAMYSAKAAGRNQCVIYSTPDAREQEDRDHEAT